MATVHELIREIRAIGQTGLQYATDPHDRERYDRLVAIGNTLYAAVSDSDVADVERFFFPEEGYATPKVDLRACVIRDDRVLLVRERSDGKWTLPGGWADQNEAPIEGVVREVKEESGYDIQVGSLYAVRDRDRHPYTPKFPVSIYKLFFTATITGGASRPNIEVSDIGFFPVDELPELSESRVLAEDIRAGFAHFRGDGGGTACD